MSSREFITLIEGLPDESWFKCQLRADIKEAEEAEVDEVALRARARMLTGLYRKVPAEKRGMHGNSH